MFQISDAAKDKITDLKPPSGTIGFGKIMAPIMYHASYSNGRWADGEVVPYTPVTIEPAAKVLHYAQSAFEGLKAYMANDTGQPNFFRPEQNWERLNRSCEKSCMPQVPKQLFLEGIHSVTYLCKDLIPNQSGQSLYLRPFIYGTQAELGMAVSDSYEFLVIASPSDAYHSGDMRLLVERNTCRSIPGSTGSVKVGANYLLALHSARRIQSLGFDQTLWLDPHQMTNIEELSGMNVFALINGDLFTPELNESFLPGITRSSLIDLARHLGHKVTEQKMPIADLLSAINDGSCSEVFACGTAAIISSVCCIGDGFEDNHIYDLPQAHPVAKQLRGKLLSIQERQKPDPFNWITSIDNQYLPINL